MSVSASAVHVAAPATKVRLRSTTTRMDPYCGTAGDLRCVATVSAAREQSAALLHRPNFQMASAVSTPHRRDQQRGSSPRSPPSRPAMRAERERAGCLAGVKGPPVSDTSRLGFGLVSNLGRAPTMTKGGGGLLGKRSSARVCGGCWPRGCRPRSTPTSPSSSTSATSVGGDWWWAMIRMIGALCYATWQQTGATGGGRPQALTAGSRSVRVYPRLGQGAAQAIVAGGRFVGSRHVPLPSSGSAAR
jgi:hypothetical protein